MDELTAWSVDRYAGITERTRRPQHLLGGQGEETAKSEWETCDNRLMDFSPTGAAVLGVGSVGDGDGGEGHITLLDAETGTVLVDLQSDENHQAAAYQYVWEDDSHVLMVVRDGDQWSDRASGHRRLDGVRRRAGHGSDRINAPFRLQTIS